MGKKSKKEVEVRPGQTIEETYKSWNLRYQIKPSLNSKEYRAMAVHSKSKKMPSISSEGKSKEECLDNIKRMIDEYKGSVCFSKQNVSVAFNVHLARDVIGHGNLVYASVVKEKGNLVLLLSDSASSGLSKAHNRLPDREDDKGQQSLTMYAPTATELGLKNARYLLGKNVEVNGVSGYELDFHSDVFDGEKIELPEPAVTVC